MNRNTTQAKVFAGIAVVLALTGTTACNQGDERMIERAKLEGRAQAEAELQAQLANLDQLAEKARIEGRASAEAEIDEQNRNLAHRAAEMEADLSGRQAFFQAVAGTYEGTMQSDQAVFNIRLTLVPNIPPVASGRIRTLDEITYDLTNLSFNVQVLQWNPRSVLSAVGCRIQAVRPDLINGIIQIASENCPNFYSLRLSNPNDPNAKPEDVAGAARSGRVTSVPEISGEVQPTTNATIFRFIATKASR